MSIDPEDYDLSNLAEEIEWRKCFPSSEVPNDRLAGFIYFCENYWTIRHPEKGRIPFILTEAQQEAAGDWLAVRWSLILKARQIGFSTLVAAFAFWAAQYPDRPILMLSRTEREAIKLLQKAKYGRQGLPEWMKFRMGPYNETQTKIELTNGSYIESLPSASDPARGESAWLIIVDEMAFLPNSEQAWGAIEPVAQVGGRVIMLSTANGEGNLFHKLWVEAQQGHSRFRPLFFPWSSAVGRDDDWYEAQKRDLPEWQLAQEYPDNPEDAFLKSGRPVFDLSVLRERMEVDVLEPQGKGYLVRKEHTVNDYEFVNDGGNLKVWEFPSEDGVYCVGADVAQGLEHGDYSTAHVINARTGTVVAHYHGHIDPDLFASEILAPLGYWYNQALIGVESNSFGLATLKVLDRMFYFPLYYERNARYKSKGKHAKPTDQLGFRTTQVTKPLIIADLGEAFREGKILLRDANTFQELKTYVRNDRNQMEGSPFDDRVMSLANANHMRKFVFMSDFQPERRPPPGSFADWERRLYGQNMSDLLEKQPGETRFTKWGDKPQRYRIGRFNVRQRVR